MTIDVASNGAAIGLQAESDYRGWIGVKAKMSVEVSFPVGSRLSTGRPCISPAKEPLGQLDAFFEQRFTPRVSNWPKRVGAWQSWIRVHPQRGRSYPFVSLTAAQGGR